MRWDEYFRKRSNFAWSSVDVAVAFAENTAIPIKRSNFFIVITFFDILIYVYTQNIQFIRQFGSICTISDALLLVNNPENVNRR